MVKTKEVEVVNPQEELAKYEPLYTRLTGWATLKVVDERSKIEALEAIRGLEELQDKYKAFRDSLVSETIKKMQKLVMEREKVIKEVIGSWKSGLRQQLGFYESEQEAIRQKEEEKLRAIQQAKYQKEVAKAEKKGEIPKPPPPPASIEKPKSDEMGFSDKATYEVVDFNLLPAEYKIQDDKKLTKVVNAGVREIPGVKIWVVKVARTKSIDVGNL